MGKENEIKVIVSEIFRKETRFSLKLKKILPEKPNLIILISSTYCHNWQSNSS